MAGDTIFALSSGAPPAAIGIIRISGPDASAALASLCRTAAPPPRRAALRSLRNADGELIDRALVLFFPGPSTATGEDLLELHCHGGRAVIAAVERAFAALPGCRRAEPGEFTRRAFANGRIDLAEAEGLADLLSAETELQRQAATSLLEGRFSAVVEGWRHILLRLSAVLEAALDFADDDGADALPADFASNLAVLAAEIADWLQRPRTERLKEGVRVVLAGPPNSGKSTLFNTLVEDEAAIVSPQAGTTRDVIERPAALAGLPFVFVDTAGLRDEEAGEVERIGIARARANLERADILLWLGPEGEGPVNAVEVDSRIDVAGHRPKKQPEHSVSGVTGEGVSELKAALLDRARSILPKPGQMTLNARQAQLLTEAQLAVEAAARLHDELVIAEHLRQARSAFDRLLGRTATEDMLDALFGRFCIGK